MQKLYKKRAVSANRIIGFPVYQRWWVSVFLRSRRGWNGAALAFRVRENPLIPGYNTDPGFSNRQVKQGEGDTAYGFSQMMRDSGRVRCR
jgi:hypothetical protein